MLPVCRPDKSCQGVSRAFCELVGQASVRELQNFLFARVSRCVLACRVGELVDQCSLRALLSEKGAEESGNHLGTEIVGDVGRYRMPQWGFCGLWTGGVKRFLGRGGSTK